MEIDGAGGAGHRVQRPRRLQARLDARRIGDVDADLACLRSGGDDVVARRKLDRDRAPENAARADEENAKTGGHRLDLNFGVESGDGGRRGGRTYRITPRRASRPGAVAPA